MQPPASHTNSAGNTAKVPDNPSTSMDIKKCRSSPSVKKKKKKKPTEPLKAEPVKLEPVIATPLLSETRSPGPYRGKCLYQSRKCENERAIKRNGKPHNLCEEHRNKQNQHQRKFDAKKFSRKRRRGSDSDEDGIKPQAIHTEEGEPVAKQLRSIAAIHQEAETRTPSRVTTSSQPTVSTIRGAFQPPVYVAGGGASPVVVARLPPIAAVHASSTASSMATDAYPRDHVGYSEYRQNGYTRPYLQQQQQVSQVSAGYSHSELVAASIMVQPQSQPSPSSVPAPRPLYHSSQAPAPVGGGQALTTPRPLPSLLVPPRSSALSPSPYHRVSSGIVASSAPRFSQVVVTPVSSASVTSVGTTVLPPLVPFGLRRTSAPMSSPDSNKK